MFRDYEVSLLALLMSGREIDSRVGYNYVKDIHGISRATVINSLKKFTELGLITVKTESTKGGWKGIYVMQNDINNKSELLDCIFNMIMDKFFFESGKMEESVKMVDVI